MSFLVSRVLRYPLSSLRGKSPLTPAGWYSVLMGESNVAIDPAIGGYGAADIYLGEFSPHSPLPGTQAGSSANLLLKSSSTRIHQYDHNDPPLT